MSVESFIREMPKVELHVHLEGAIQPKTLLHLAQKNQIDLPYSTVEELEQWYQYQNFEHFIGIYILTSRCIQTIENIEFITKEFLKGQAAQNIVYTEVTYTAYTHYQNNQISFSDQFAAIQRAKKWAEVELGVSMGLIVDISRHVTSEEGTLIANWAIQGMEQGVIALGLGGPEIGNPPEKFEEAFELARKAGLPSVPHAGETVGPQSIWGALNSLHAQRIGHGVRCLEDSELVAFLREKQIPLEVCPTSNLCLKVFSELDSHPLPKLLAEGLNVSINSDDPPMFGTTLTNEYIATAQAFGFSFEVLETLVLNACSASFLSRKDKDSLRDNLLRQFSRLRPQLEAA